MGLICEKVSMCELKMTESEFGGRDFALGLLYCSPQEEKARIC